MSWATHHIARLQNNETVEFRPHGNSMTPRIYNGDLCRVSPCKLEELEIGDVVLCHVSGNDYLHLITAKREDRVQISNNHGYVNGWTSKIYGKLISVEAR